MFHNFNRDISYILKRVIVGVLIALILGFLSTRKVSALTSNFDSVLMCSNNMGCSTSLSLPYSYAYSDSARVNFSGINLIQGKSYSINFTMTLTSPSFSFNLDYPQLFVIDSSGNPVRAYPDRGNSLQVNNLGNNNYSVVWNFELDNTGGNFTSAYVIFVFTSSYNQNIYSTTINSSSFLYYDLSDPTGNQDIINNQNNNTQNIINNNNSNTVDIINNQNENTEKEIESQKVCDKKNLSYRTGTQGSYINVSGNIVNISYGVLTDYLSINDTSSLELIGGRSSTACSTCFYDNEKNLISCITNTPEHVGFLTIPNNASYFRTSFILNVDDIKFNYSYCKNGNQAINDFLSDDNTEGTIGIGKNFLENFNANSHGLGSILTAPFRLLNSLTTATCSPLQFQLPFIHNQVTLPCMRGIYEEHFGVFFTLWQMITTGLISYHVCINLYSKIHDLQNPNADRIEVLNL